jgi:hypothetical protein
MGGIHCFHVALENCKGNWELVEEAMKGANTPVDPAGDDRKGGAQGIAKAFLSAGVDKLCIYLHVPDNLKDVDINAWFDVLVKAAGATVVQAPKDGYAKAETLKGDEIFPLKKRDEAIGLGFAFLRANKLVPEVESSSEGEMGSFEENYEW